MLKRVFDIIASLAGLILVLPFVAALSLALLCSQGWPVLFRQIRVGLGGRDFTLFKFRTMTVLTGTEKGSFEAGSLRRVTPLGRFLRDTKVDELPQLWNVLRGDMSIVGPRPEVRRWVSEYPDRWQRVLTVRPGITDPASIAFRNEESLLSVSTDPERTYRLEVLPQKLDLYERYVQTRTFLGDLGVIVRTLLAVSRCSASGTGDRRH